MRQVRRTIRALIVALLAVAAPTLAFAATDLILQPSGGETVRLTRPAHSIFIADPNVADIQTPNNTTVFVFGKGIGRTTLFALDEAGEKVAHYQVVVRRPIEDLLSLLRGEVGDYALSASYTPSGLIVSGLVPNAQIAESVRSLASQFAGAGSTVQNRLKVAGRLQVNLRVRIAEVSRSKTRELGFNWNAVANAGEFAVGLQSGKSLMNALASLSGGSAGSGQKVKAQWSGKDANILAVIDAMAENGLIHILAEPNLTAVSGESASFLAGGEFPIPVAQGNGNVALEFRRFGVGLEFVPTVLADEAISIRVRPEVSELSAQGAVTINGFNVPGIATRRAETTVDLASGQSFAIAGLLRNTANVNAGRFPGLSDLPVLGALFRSDRFRRDETELVIIVTPYLARPAPSPEALRTPLGPMPAAARLRPPEPRSPCCTAPSAPRRTAFDTYQLRRPALVTK